jgi:hypothetical protein
MQLPCNPMQVNAVTRRWYLTSKCQTIWRPMQPLKDMLRPLHWRNVAIACTGGNMDLAQQLQCNPMESHAVNRKTYLESSTYGLSKLLHWRDGLLRAKIHSDTITSMYANVIQMHDVGIVYDTVSAASFPMQSSPGSLHRRKSNPALNTAKPMQANTVQWSGLEFMPGIYSKDLQSLPDLSEQLHWRESLFTAFSS